MEDRADDKGTRVPRTDFGRRFDMAFGAAREFIRIRFAEDGCVVGIDQVAGGWIDFCWNEEGDRPREPSPGLLARLQGRSDREEPR